VFYIVTSSHRHCLRGTTMREHEMDFPVVSAGENDTSDSLVHGARARIAQ
jgi:hypothetical protein